MSLALIVYLAEVADKLSALLIITTSCLLAAALAETVAEDKVTTWTKRWLFSGVLCALLAVFVPNKETIYVMVAAKTVEDIASSPKVQELGGKSLDVINKVMDDYLKQTTSKEEK